MTGRSKFGWLDFISGLALAVLGVYVFFTPQAALSGLVAVYSILAIVTGILDIVFYVRLKSGTGFGPAISLVTGIISVLAGFMLLLNPLLGRWIFSLAFPVWIIAHNISRLANYRHIRFVAGRASAAVSLALNIIGIVVGILLLVHPTLSTISLGYLVAAGLVLHGVGNIVEAFSGIGAKTYGEQEDPRWQ